MIDICTPDSPEWKRTTKLRAAPDIDLCRRSMKRIIKLMDYNPDRPEWKRTSYKPRVAPDIECHRIIKSEKVEKLYDPKLMEFSKQIPD